MNMMARIMTVMTMMTMMLLMNIELSDSANHTYRPLPWQPKPDFVDAEQDGLSSSRSTSTGEEHDENQVEIEDVGKIA